MDEYRALWINSKYERYVKWLFDGNAGGLSVGELIKSIPEMHESECPEAGCVKSSAKAGVYAI